MRNQDHQRKKNTWNCATSFLLVRTVWKYRALVSECGVWAIQYGFLKNNFGGNWGNRNLKEKKNFSFLLSKVHCMYTCNVVQVTVHIVKISSMTYGLTLDWVHKTDSALWHSWLYYCMSLYFFPLKMFCGQFCSFICLINLR